MWVPIAWDKTEQEKSRKLIICCADYVVPGHGKVFIVDRIIKEKFNCIDAENRKISERICFFMNNTL